jgi:glycosyltransferase involved in cell wall biosynthesis
MEAMSAGRVCIASNASGADEIIEDRVSGYLVRDNDAAALASAIEAVRRMTPEMRAAVGKRAQSAMSSFRWPVIAKRHLDFLFGSAASGITTDLIKGGPGTYKSI